MQQLLCRDAATNYLVEIGQQREKKRERICAFQADIPHHVGILPVGRIHFTCWKIAFYPGGEIKRLASRYQASGITLSIVRHHVAKHLASRCQPVFLKCLKDAADGNAIYYDLSGRRVAEPKQGLYIVNGKKVVVK